ncbi:aminodeoxychorismate synthase component I [Dysgonomonas sp. BGC7]|uniref:aminodeoxychorismate synthase component I n=1 Tax=Dysgonomonas sp. BGC7 TaxID=1658008 RepID=UPI0006809266|nr:aminodeoxychorismate synthase component I [Dysgonomonas sp. BGC7]
METIKDIDVIRHKMNSFGVRKEPFLFAVDFELTEGLFIENPLEQKAIFFDVNGVGNTILEASVSSDAIKFTSVPISYSKFQDKFETVHRGLLKGDSYLTNLSIKTPVCINLSLEEIYSKSIARYKLFLPNRFVCFSPERFVRIEGKRISTNPMKGTIDASIDNAESLILNDFKETAEHNTIVDLLRNDLSMISNNVKVERFRYIDRIKTHQSEILQVCSEISGTLHDDNKDLLGDIIFRMLPAGSISGAPKKATSDLIRMAEKQDRGFYTGVFGYYDGNVLDTAVLIRFIEQSADGYYYRSGGGITAYSDCESEYKEMLDKIYLPII